MKNSRLFFPILLMNILLPMRRVVTSDPYGKAKISNIEDEQYFFCHKSLIIVCIRLDDTYISSIVVNDNDIPCRLEWNIIELLRYLQFK